MSSGSSLPYKLRPNKAVDRELFLSLLTRLASILKIESHQYIGLGGAFLEDFRLIHARLGIDDMICLEIEENVHKRQCFNRPVDCITCIHNSLENYLDSTELDKPVIIWFDYTDPGSVIEQIERFSRTISEVPIGSILRITLNANPGSLGQPSKEEIAITFDDLDSHDGGNLTIQEWRLEKFRQRLGSLFPSNLDAGEMTYKNYGKSILKALSLAVEKVELSIHDRNIVWSLATHYADGQPMATATLIVCKKDDSALEKGIKEWEFYCTPDSPLLLDMPALSTLERLIMESSTDAKEVMGFELPKSDMGTDPFETFKKFYRIFPHFSKVEL